ncbi:MAG: sporulation protein YunB [Limnochordaceae bacterium]|nr:sporulation protein YunB [Limnochordaceae bacterium]
MWSRTGGPIGGSRNAGQWRTLAGAVLVALMLGAVGLGWALDRMLTPPIDRWARQQLTLLASRAVAEAADQVGQAAGMRPLVTYRMGSDQQVVGIEYNWLVISRIMARTAQSLDRELRNLSSQDVSVPLGEVTGLRTIGGRGPAVRVRLVSVGSFTVEPFSEFRDAGYNQTLHRIGLGVSVQVAVVAPFIGDTVRVEARIPVVENQVVGRVPAFLMQTGNLQIGGRARARPWAAGRRRPPGRARLHPLREVDMG